MQWEESKEFAGDILKIASNRTRNFGSVHNFCLREVVFFERLFHLEATCVTL